MKKFLANNIDVVIVLVLFVIAISSIMWRIINMGAKS